MNEFSLKELYDVKIKATYPLTINGEQYSTGETLVEFDKLMIANFNEVRSFISARGGYGNTVRVSWDNLKEVAISFSQGIFSTLQWAIFTNSHLGEIAPENDILIGKREKIESDENGLIHLTYAPAGEVFFRDENGKKISDIIATENIKIFEAPRPYMEVIADYEFAYSKGGTILTIGKKFMSGFLSLEGKTRVKDDVTGHTHTGIIKIPKIQLMSDFQVQLGQNAKPVVGLFKAMAYPVGPRGDKKAIDLIILNDDLDSDII